MTALVLARTTGWTDLRAETLDKYRKTTDESQLDALQQSSVWSVSGGLRLLLTN